ncbi:class II fructose-bisphosphate aldolase [Candidatus Wolfebacteria bacterium]|nr:class II fructose-bisphosphate aldolase [Candidatus Wolfebacteria bacterium]
MQTLKQIIKEAEQKKVAVGHFNISECVALKGIFKAAQELNLPVIIGLSEGEREFMGIKRAALMVKSLREEFNYPIFLNADHTHSFEKIKEAVEAGFDAVLFDAGKLPFEENIKKTKEVVEYVKSVNPDILIEAELGYIGASSTILKEIPKDAAVNPEDLTKPEQAAQFVKETKIDLLAPAVGNIHGMFKNAPNPNLNIERIAKIRKAAGVPLVLHGGSGLRDEEFIKAINAGISIIHINTEIRLAWRVGMEKALAQNPEEITPYKILPLAIEEIKKTVENRLKLFSKNY